MGGGAREVTGGELTEWEVQGPDREPRQRFGGEEDGEGGKGNPLGELGENDSHLRQAGYSCVHRCAPRCAKL